MNHQVAWIDLCSVHNAQAWDSVKPNKEERVWPGVALKRMELILSMLSLASFVVLIGAWVAVPHPSLPARAADRISDTGAAQAVGAN